jgi:hypothetical protein
MLPVFDGVVVAAMCSRSLLEESGASSSHLCCSEFHEEFSFPDSLGVLHHVITP